jgi:formate/nitrite transporter FocA (FNT family)
VLIALLIGFLLAAPSLNHAVVGFGEMFFGLVAGTAEVGWVDLVQNLWVAVLGNLVGGLGVITATRLLQVSGDEGGGVQA